MKVREFAKQEGTIEAVLDNKFYDVKFGDEILQLNEQELKKHNPDEKVVTLTGLKKQLTTKSTPELQPEKEQFNNTEVDNEIEDEVDANVEDANAEDTIKPEQEEEINSGDINSGDINSGDINSDDISKIRKTL